MSNLRIENSGMVRTKPRLSRGWSVFGGLVLVTILAVSPTLLGPAHARGGKGSSLGSAASNALEDYGLRHPSGMPVASDPGAYYEGSDYAERRAAARLAEFNLGADFAQRRMAAQLAEFNLGTDFAQRHPEMTSWIIAIDTSDYFLRHPELLGLADAGGGKGHSFGDVTFMKWITMYPTMEGIVGGAVGAGTFAGEIVSMTGSDDGNTAFVEAVYHVNGSDRSFTANIKAVQDNGAGTGVITGEITDGWLEDKALSGEYTVIPECNVGDYSGMCFQGTLHILPPP